jgi:hypothetical protein
LPYWPLTGRFLTSKFWLFNNSRDLLQGDRIKFCPRISTGYP